MSNDLDGEKIYAKLDSIDGKVDQLLLWKAEHIQAHVLVERDVADNRAALFNNPGVLGKVNALWNCKKSVTKWKEFWTDVLRYLIVAFIVTVITWLLVIYKGSS